MPGLSELLTELSLQDDRRPLVRALCAAARVQLPIASRTDRYNEVAIEVAEAWARGACDAKRLAEVRARARKTPGGGFSCAALSVIGAPADRVRLQIQLFCSAPLSVWRNSERGEAWSRENGPHRAFSDDPLAWAEILAVEQELCALARAACDGAPP